MDGRKYESTWFLIIEFKRFRFMITVTVAYVLCSDTEVKDAFWRKTKHSFAKADSGENGRDS